MKKLLLVLALVLILSVGVQAYEETIQISSGSLGGNWFPMMSALGEMILKPNGIGYDNSPGGGTANVMALHNRDADIGLTMTLTLDWAKNARDPFKEKIEDVQALVSFYPDILHIVAGKDTDIHSIKDLKGKRVAVQLPGHTAAEIFKDMLAVYDMTEDDMKLRRGSPGEGQKLFNDGHVDAWVYTSPLPSPDVMLMLDSRDSRIVGLTDAEVSKMGGGYAPAVIPSDVYPKLDEDVQTAKVSVIIATHEDLSVDLGYKLTKAICENFEVMWEVRSALKGRTAEDLADIPAGTPVHPGAQKYFEDEGLK